MKTVVKEPPQGTHIEKYCVGWLQKVFAKYFVGVVNHKVRVEVRSIQYCLFLACYLFAGRKLNGKKGFILISHRN